MNKVVFYSIILILPSLQGCAVFRLLNSGTANIKYKTSTAKFNDIEYQNKTKINNFSASIRNVQHPKKYGKWNFNIGLSPSISFTNQVYGTLHVNPNSPVGAPLPDISLQRLITMANIGMHIHTPAGSFNFKAGYGRTLSDISDGQGLDTVTSKPIRKLDLAYIAFFSKRWFFQTGPRYYKEEFESFAWSIRLGIFWGKI